MKNGIVAVDGSYIPSDYTGVFSREYRWEGRNLGRKFLAKMTHKGITWHSKLCETEREAALAYDKRRIELGLEPINILTRAIE